MIPSDNRSKERLVLAGSLLVVTTLGFYLKFGYQGPGREWAFCYGAAVFYEIFWILLVRLTFRRPALKTAIWVLGITCVLEALQLWRPGWLQTIRSTFAGGVLLGTTFVWWDFPHYLVGSAVGYWLLLLLVRQRGVNPLETDIS